SPRSNAWQIRSSFFPERLRGIYVLFEQTSTIPCDFTRCSFGPPSHLVHPRSATTTVMPFRASVFAIARPELAPPPPVTSATFLLGSKRDNNRKGLSRKGSMPLNCVLITADARNPRPDPKDTAARGRKAPTC